MAANDRKDGCYEGIRKLGPDIHNLFEFRGKPKIRCVYECACFCKFTIGGSDRPADAWYGANFCCNCGAYKRDAPAVTDN